MYKTPKKVVNQLRSPDVILQKIKKIPSKNTHLCIFNYIYVLFIYYFSNLCNEKRIPYYWLNKKSLAIVWIAFTESHSAKTYFKENESGHL